MLSSQVYLALVANFLKNNFLCKNGQNCPEQRLKNYKQNLKQKYTLNKSRSTLNVDNFLNLTSKYYSPSFKFSYNL